MPPSTLSLDELVPAHCTRASRSVLSFRIEYGYANHFQRTLQHVHFIVYGICESFGVLNYGAANSQCVLLLYGTVYVCEYIIRHCCSM
jgi:hypothetical protein